MVLHISSEQLYILTLYDGLEENNKYQIVFRNGESAEATVLGTDVVTGLAVISAEVESLSQEVLDSVRSAEIGSSKSLQVGDLVVAIGNPMGSMYSIGYGLIGSEPSTRYLTDRKISLYCTNLQYVSNGGGVVMNTSGKVIGIITHRFDEDNVGIHTFMGITEIEELILQLMNHERRGTMGIVVSDITQAYLNELGVPNGVYVTDVASGSPAMQAGISVGDVLIPLRARILMRCQNSLAL